MNKSVILKVRATSIELWNAMAVHWQEPRLLVGWPLEELEQLDDFTRRLAEKTLAVALEMDIVEAWLNDLQMDIRAEALHWLRCRKVAKKSAQWSPQMAFYFTDLQWHGEHLAHAWAIKHSTLLTRTWSEDELAWLNAWAMMGESTPVIDPVGALMHKTTSRGEINYVNEDQRFVAPPPLPELAGPRIQLARSRRSPSDDRWSDLQIKRSSRMGQRKPMSVTQAGELLDTIFHSAQGTHPYPASGGFYAVQAVLDIAACEGLGRGHYLYDRTAHSLQKFSDKNFYADGVALFFAADFSSWHAKYRFLPYRLALLDTGVLYQQTALAIANCGLEGTPLGWNMGPQQEKVLKLGLGKNWQSIGCYRIGSK